MSRHCKMIVQVNSCPSSILSFCYNDNAAQITNTTTPTKVELMHNKPLLMYGNITPKDQHGNETQKHKVTTIYRCGFSGNKPYCDV